MRILMSMFGWNDVGGGTSYPRQVAVNLVRRGHQVCIFYAAVPEWMPSGVPSRPRLIQHSEDGVMLVAVQDRPTVFLDTRRPDREASDPMMVEAFREVFEAFAPDVVHYQNFLGLSEAIAEISYTAGVPSLFSAHNFWMVCPTLYLYLPSGELCGGVNASGSNCRNCARLQDEPWSPYLPPAEAYLTRRDTLRARFLEWIDIGLTNAQSVRQHFLNNGYPPESVQVQKLSNPRVDVIWQEVGVHRELAVPARLRIGFFGQVIPIKGVHTLVQAVQRLQGDFEVQIHGAGSESYVQNLQALDQRGVVRFYGGYGPHDQAAKLAEIDLGVVTSIWFDHSPLVIGEFHSALIPVIGADIGGMRDYLQPAASRLYPPGDVEALAAILQELLDDRELLTEMKAKIVKPPGPEVYLDAVEGHYQRLVAASRLPESDYYQRRIAHFLAQRRSDCRYAAASLFLLRQEQGAFGLDLHSREFLASLDTEQLQRADWRISPSRELAAELSAQGLPTLWLPLNRAEPDPLTAEPYTLPESSQRPVLLPLDAAGDWREAFSRFLATPAPDWTPLLLPWELTLAEAEAALLAALADAGIDPEAAPEMILLEHEQAQALDSLFHQVEAVFLPGSPDARLLELIAGSSRLLLHSRARPERHLAPLASDWIPAGVPASALHRATVTAKAYNRELQQKFFTWIVSSLSESATQAF